MLAGLGLGCCAVSLSRRHPNSRVIWRLKEPRQDAKHNSKHIQCQQHVILVTPLILAISNDAAREQRQTETWRGFPILASQQPHHPNTRAIEPHGLGGTKQGREGRQVVHHGAARGRRGEGRSVTWRKLLVQDPSDKSCRAKHSPSLRSGSDASP